MRTMCLFVLTGVILLGKNRPADSSDVVEMVLTALALDHDDTALGDALKEVKLTDRLTRSTVAFLEQQGTGPHASSVLERLSDRSAGLVPPTQEVISIETPAKPEQDAMIQRMLRYAAAYGHSLPDFLCDATTQRYTNLFLKPSNTGATMHAHYEDRWRRDDRFTKVLRFVQGQEREEVVSVNHKPAKNVSTAAGQSISRGEFGGDMELILGAHSSALLSWDHWEMFRGKHAAVFRYDVVAGRSKFVVAYCCVPSHDGSELTQQYAAPIRGFIYTDADTGTILRITIRAVDLPTSFRVKQSNTVIDYGTVVLSGRAYVLPIKAITFMQTERQKNRNEIQFSNYRKFDAESVLLFTNSKGK